MTKTEAAELLSVSEKTISRYVATGKLTGRYVAGKTGRQLEFDADDVERFKVESAAPIEVRQDRTTAIVPTVPGVPTSELLAEFVRAVVAETGQGKSIIPTSEKMVLSLDEAAALSGVPRGVLNDARRAGHLRTRKLGRGYKVLRADLESFAAGLFAD